MMNYHKTKSFLLLILSFVSITSSCRYAKKTVTPAPTPAIPVKTQPNLHTLAGALAGNADFQSYINTLADVYTGQSKMVKTTYKGNAETYYTEVRAVHRNLESTGWTEDKVTQLDQKMGLKKGTLLSVATKKRIVLSKFSEIGKLSDKDNQLLLQKSIALLVKNTDLVITTSCSKRSKYRYFAGMPKATGISMSLMTGCLVFTLPSETAACAGLIILGDAFIINNCHSKSRI